MQTYSLIATCAAGIESILTQELKDLGYSTQTENGRVRFQGTAKDIAYTNLWLRTADRIKILVGEFPARSFESLFDQVYALAWQDFLPMDANFPVSGKSIKSQLHSVPNVQRISKKAIAKKLMDYYHRRSPLPETGALYPIDVALRKNQVEVSLDTSGSSLFKRGYRAEKGQAPLKENMAAALVKLTTWYPDRPLYDPTCGSGTILIEAAMMAHNIAPGLFRHFAVEDWEYFHPEIWSDLRQEARQAQNFDLDLDILGTDIDPKMIEIAKQNAEKAGVAESIHFKQMQLADFTTDKEYGILIANPPYGDRMLSTNQVHQLYQDMGNLYRPLTTWSKYILSSDEAFEEYYGQKATKKRKLYNGAIKVDYYQFWGSK
ncbi:THUMP domain-containing class I SAM-dependent RNA methyltransferase [Ignavigranum ruoffiae]|uniref:Putative N6-adenine-specific DNA methylase n=1 Tax=Ignavigranum ruoffiae TaxID=89093 RepID=A0A1H8ZZL5_9LACT|nr:class I SAM-dependent RNA methyltransferase [Ignavigranum ruoffiae]UPQ85691.1 class I SAM-dependent RNA methyltransferase [Ignavigranum ruoffiae]SEP69701.1 putative N6-adenine-specific DNA methylase [Ignavigranum ruoffiae]